MKILKIIAFLVGFLIGSALQGQQPPALGGAAAAVVRIPTHGASATVVWTGQNKSILLGCAHAYEGSSRNQKMGFDIPSNTPIKSRVTSHLIAIDYQMDLSLVELDVGPLPYVAPVAGPGYKLGTRLYACGYDEMKIPMHQDLVHVLDVGMSPVRMASKAEVYHTRERPGHGRSGGGLIDIDAGVVIGVCEAENFFGGYYVDLNTIYKFLAIYYPQDQPRAPSQTSKTYVEIPTDCRVPNRTGTQCAWAALESAARYLKLTKLYHLTQEYKTSEPYSPQQISAVLSHFGVRHKLQLPGNRDKTILLESISQGLPVAIGVHMKHSMLLVGIDERQVKLLANSTDQDIHTESLNDFMSEWDGLAITLFPDAVSGGPPNDVQVPTPHQEFYYQNVGPVIPKEQFYQQPQQYFVPQKRYYVPQQNCPT